MGLEGCACVLCGYLSEYTSLVWPWLRPRIWVVFWDSDRSEAHRDYLNKHRTRAAFSRNRAPCLLPCGTQPRTPGAEVGREDARGCEGGNGGTVQ